MYKCYRTYKISCTFVTISLPNISYFYTTLFCNTKILRNFIDHESISSGVQLYKFSLRFQVFCVVLKLSEIKER